MRTFESITRKSLVIQNLKETMNAYIVHKGYTLCKSFVVEIDHRRQSNRMILG